MKNNIVLCGFMGCGKTTVGKAFAQKYNMRFVDSDSCIEQHEGKTVSKIFEQNGEKYFRKLEHDILSELSNQSGLVIATGGGAMLDPENVRVLKENGLIVLLEITPETVLKRLENDTTRPLLQKDDKESAVRELLEKRSPIYKAAADFSVDASRPIEKIAEEIYTYFSNS